LFDATETQSVAQALLTALEIKNLRREAAGLNQNIIAKRAEYRSNMERAEEFYRAVIR
jgi:hypothetical protein